MDHEPQPSIIGSLWRYRWLSLVIVATATLLSAASGLLVVPPASATATVALRTPADTNVLAPGIQGDASLARYTAQRARFATSDEVVQIVADELGRDDVTALRRQLTVTPAQDTNTMAVTAEAPTPELAAELAAAVVAGYRARTEAQVGELTDEALAAIDESVVRTTTALTPDQPPEMVSSVATTLHELRLEASELERSRAVFGDGVEFVVAPRVEAATTPGPPVREAALGFVVGLVVAATVAWLLADRAARAAPPARPASREELAEVRSS